MSSKRLTYWLHRAFASLALAAVLAGLLPAEAEAGILRSAVFASPRFEQVWQNSDLPVSQQRSNRSWTWGPSPWSDYMEFYKQSPNGLRLVQYFDKARMEINNPAETSGPLGGVTNGLLVVEMVSGRVKLGDAIGPDQNDQRDPAFNIPVAGDQRMQPDSVTYGTFRSVATTDNGYRDASKLGQRAGNTITTGTSGVPTFGSDPRLAALSGTEIVAYDSVTGHNVARIFEDFRNAGPVAPIFAFGHPITDPYWVKATVAGEQRDVLVQLFERRALTYTPANPKAFQVEMGNVGQHYFRWRYPHLGMPWARGPEVMPIVFASKRGTAEFNLYAVNVGAQKYGPYFGTDERPVTTGATETVPFSWLRSTELAQVRLFGDTKRFNGKRQVVSMRPDASDVQRVLASNANDYNPSVSPDGTKVLFASDRDGNPELYIMNLQGTVAQLTATVGCANQYPSWLADGSGFVYESNCEDRNYEIYRAALSYNQDKPGDLAVSSPVRSTRLTRSAGDDRYPRLSAGNAIAFTTTRDGNPEIYTMSSNGEQLARITNNPAVDEAPAWGPDGPVFSSNRDGDYSIWIQSSFPNVHEYRLTSAGPEDRWPLWHE